MQNQKSQIDIKQEICETFKDVIASNQLIVRDELFIDAKRLDSDTLDKIRAAVLEYGMSYPSFGESIPTAWRDLHLELDKMRSTGTMIVSMEEIRRINSRMKSPLEDQELNVFIDFLHGVGYCLHFEEGALSDYVILEPKWVIDAMKIFITCDKFGFRFWEKRKWLKMRSTGQVKESYIIKQWQSRGGGSFFEHREYLMLVLEKLDILCRAKIYDENGNVDNADFFLVPCMVNASIREPIRGQHSTVDMLYTFPTVVPVAIYNRLVCACLVLWPVYKGHLYSGLVVLKSGQYHLIKLRMKDGNIVVSFDHMISLENIDIHVCRTVRQFLNKALDSIMKTYKADAQKLYHLEYNNEAISRNFCNTDTLVKITDVKRKNDVFKEYLRLYIRSFHLRFRGVGSYPMMYTIRAKWSVKVWRP